MEVKQSDQSTESKLLKEVSLESSSAVVHTSQNEDSDVDCHKMTKQTCKKGILVFGRRHSGKHTIVYRGLFPDDDNDTVAPKSELNPGKNLRAKKIEHLGVEYNIVMINSLVNGKTEIPLRKLYEQNKDEFPERISMILFVYRHSRFTDEDQAFFSETIKSFNETASSLCAAVITNCDGHTEDTKQRTVDEFKTNRNTQHIASFMEKGIYCLSFPDESAVTEELKGLYAAEIPGSQKILKKLLQDSDTSESLMITSILKPLPSKSWSGIHGKYGRSS